MFQIKEPDVILLVPTKNFAPAPSVVTGAPVVLVVFCVKVPPKPELSPFNTNEPVPVWLTLPLAPAIEPLKVTVPSPEMFKVECLIGPVAVSK